MNKYWKDFVKVISEGIDEFEGEAAEMILYSITDDVGGLFSLIRDIMAGEDCRSEMVSTIGHIYFNIALMELYWDLPPTLYTEYIGEEMKDSNDPSVSVHYILTNIMTCIANISTALKEDNKIDVQKNLNDLLQHVYDVCILHNINTIEPLKESFKEVKTDFGITDKVDFEADYKVRKSLIKELEYNEILFDVVLDNRRTVPYKGVSINAYGKEHVSSTGDIIGDFFKCMNYIDKIKTDNNYVINYGPKFRDYMSKNNDKVWSGFLIDHQVVSITDVQKNKKAVNGVITLTKEARPILMNKEIKDFNTLIDYIDKYKK